MKGGKDFQVSVTLTLGEYNKLKSEMSNGVIDSIPAATTSSSIETPTSSSIETPTSSSIEPPTSSSIEPPTEENPKTVKVSLKRSSVDIIVTKLREKYEYLEPRYRKVTKAELDSLEPIFVGVKSEVNTILTGNETKKIFQYSALRDSIFIHIIGIENFVNWCAGVDSKKDKWGFTKEKRGFTNEEKQGDFERMQTYVEKAMKKLEENRTAPINTRWMKEEHIKTLESFGLNHIWDHILKFKKQEEKPISSSLKTSVELKLKPNVLEDNHSKQIKKEFLVLFRKFYAIHKDNFNTEREEKEEEIERERKKNWPDGLRQRNGDKKVGGNVLVALRKSFATYKEAKLIGAGLAYIFAFFLFLESYRKLAYQIDRIITANETYLLAYPVEVERAPDHTDILSSILSVFYVMHQVVHGRILEWIRRINTPQTYDDIKNLIGTAADTATQKVVASCIDGYFGCFNGLLTGVVPTHLKNEMLQQTNDAAEFEWLKQKQLLLSEGRDIMFEYELATSNIVCGINICSFSTLVILNTFRPKIYTDDMVGFSAVALAGAYKYGGIWDQLCCTGAQVMILLKPLPGLIMQNQEEGQRENQDQAQEQIQIPNGPADGHIQEDEKIPEEILAIENNVQVKHGMDIREKIARIKHDRELLDSLNSKLPTARGGSQNGGSRKKQSHKNYRKKSHKKKYTRNSKQTRKQRRRKTKSKK